MVTKLFADVDYNIFEKLQELWVRLLHLGILKYNERLLNVFDNHLKLVFLLLFGYKVLKGLYVDLLHRSQNVDRAEVSQNKSMVDFIMISVIPYGTYHSAIKYGQVGDTVLPESRLERVEQKYRGDHDCEVLYVFAINSILWQENLHKSYAQAEPHDADCAEPGDISHVLLILVRND